MRFSRFSKEQLEKWYNIEYCFEKIKQNDSNIQKCKFEFNNSNIDKMFKDLHISYIILFVRMTNIIEVEYFREKLKNVTFTDLQFEDLMEADVEKIKDRNLWEHWIQTVNYPVVKHVPEEFRDYNLYKLFVEYYKWNGIKYVPKEFRTKELFEIVLDKEYYDGLELFSEEYFNDEICKKVVKSFNGILHIPEKLITKELYEMGFEYDFHIITLIPEEYQTFDMFLKIIQNDDFNEEYSKYIPEWVIEKIYYESPELLTNFRISRVPEKYRTYELCLRVIKEFSESMSFYMDKYIPKKFWTEELLWEVIDNEPKFILRVHNPSYKLIKLAVSRRKWLISKYQDKLTTQDLIELINENPELIEYVDIKKHTRVWGYFSLKYLV